MRWRTSEPSREDSTTWTLRRGELGVALIRTNMDHEGKVGVVQSNRYKQLARHYIHEVRQETLTSPMSGSQRRRKSAEVGTKAGSISQTMPAIRRVHAAGAVQQLSVSAAYHQRQQLQRNHFLRTLAVKAGFSDWERFRP